MLPPEAALSLPLPPLPPVALFALVGPLNPEPSAPGILPTPPAEPEETCLEPRAESAPFAGRRGVVGAAAGEAEYAAGLA